MTPSNSVVVTGTSTGIGRTTALLLDREGYRVFAGVRRREDGETLRREASERLEPLLLDVTDAAAIEAAAKEVTTAVGDAGLAGLVNNAGIGVGGPLEFVDLDEMRRCFEVNVFGVAAVTRAFMPLVRKAKGRVVNVSSGAGKVATPLLGPYCASKFALEALSNALRVELRSFGVQVAVIEPGFVETPMIGKGQDDVDRQLRELPEEAKPYYSSPLVKMGETFERFSKSACSPERVAGAILSALTARRPRTRYTVGIDSKLMASLSRILPDRAIDSILGRMVGL